MISVRPTGIRIRHKFLRCEKGSITPLAVGFAVLALTLVVVMTIATDIYLAHRKLFALADSAALTAAEAYDSTPAADPTVVYSPSEVDRRARNFITNSQLSSRWSHVSLTSDVSNTHTITVDIQAAYKPALISVFVPDGITLHATAQVHGVLRASR